MASRRAFYSDTISGFLASSPDAILGALTKHSDFAVGQDQRNAWLEEIEILRTALHGRDGSAYFEYSIPRMGKRIDVVLLIGAVIFVLEFKVGESEFTSSASDQVWDYALDLKNFHETSFGPVVAPVLVPTKARTATPHIVATANNDKLLVPINCTVPLLGHVIDDVLRVAHGPAIDASQWEAGRYCPTPTIIEAAMALYNGHSVTDISRNDATAINLSTTSDAISEIIRRSKEQSQKSICFVTGVPGAGKTLVGLNIATKHIDQSSDLYSVFLSGNGPLVDVLREALARDRIRKDRERGGKLTKGSVMSEVKAFIQNVHHFRDDCLENTAMPPVEHVALFDEAQRAWNAKQTSEFMRRKRRNPNFVLSEPEFLISCMDRHSDWAVIVCLVGGGQEINTGEAGISEWIESVKRSFPDWCVYVSSRLSDSEYAAGSILGEATPGISVVHRDELHLSVSMRSFRAEHVSLLVKQILDKDAEAARKTLAAIRDKFPIVITRDLSSAKQWLKKKAMGSERYGIVVSSQAERLKPHAIDVKSPIKPVHWFLDEKDDVRSSYYLEDVATEFHVQGLEIDWACVTWDADFRHGRDGWEHWAFRGSRWNRIRQEERKNYQKNAYRVLLTRARQGMVIVVPPGDAEDLTRKCEFYDPTFEYLSGIGFDSI